jgi:GNAT superfamily N-acetyltransferase
MDINVRNMGEEITMDIRQITQQEVSPALELIWNVFNEFEAPEYSNEGIKTFEKFIRDNDAIALLEIYGAFEHDNLLGVIAVRGKNHIAMFFLRKQYHRKGIGRKLFEYALQNCDSDSITVNSSPYAVPIYQRLGFVNTNEEQTVDGIRFTPMLYAIRKKDNKVNVIIREANEKDAAAICKLSREGLGYDYSLEKTQQKLINLLKECKHKILVAQLESDCVGYIHGNIHSLLYCDEMINIMGIAVLERYKRNGIGKKLLEAIENWGTEMGVAGVRLTSGESRTAAHKFYEGCGYESHKMQKNFIKML